MKEVLLQGWKKVGDDRYERELTVGKGEDQLIVTIVVTKAQIEKIDKWVQEGWVLGIRRQKGIHYPAMLMSKGGKAKHLGGVLYNLGEKARWNPDWFLGEEWDFTPDNTLAPRDGTFHCMQSHCRKWFPDSERARDSSIQCAECEHINSLLKAAKRRGKDFSLAREEFTGTHCEISGLPLVKKSSGARACLTQESLDRRDSTKGYVSSNVWKICAGINFLKGNHTEEELKTFLGKVGQGEKKSLANWTPNTVWKQKGKINNMLSHARTKTPDTDLTSEFLMELVRQTGGVCGITGVPLDLKNPVGMYAPSLDRINVEGGYTKDNVWIVSQAANKMKWASTTDQVRLFIKDVVKGCREKGFIGK